MTTSGVSAPTQVTITATFGGGSRSTTITVSPFIFSSVTPALADFSVNPTTVSGGARSVGRVTLTSAAPDPSDGVVSVALTSDNEAAVVVARKVTVGHGGVIGDFRIRTFAVAEPTLVTLTATFNGVTRSATLTVNPSGSTPPPPLALSAVSVNPTAVVGGNPSTGTATLNRAAPAGGVSVALSTDNTVASVPASVTVPAGETSASFQVSTTAVAASTSAIITGVFDGVSRSATLTVNPAAPPPTPEAPSLVSPAQNATPAQPVTFDWTDVANAASYEIQIDNTSTIAAPFVASATVTVSQATIGGLPAQRLWWRVRARNSAGVFGPFSATRRFTPQASTTASLSSVSVNPTSVVGGNSSNGTATLTAAGPSGGAVVSLSSSNTAVATVPASVTIAAGSTSATVTVTTSSVTANTPVTITATYNGVSRTTTLTVTPPAQNATLTVTATGRAGERVTSSPAGINVTVGSTGSASFAIGTSITLSVSNSRDAIWSGACSSGGNKAKTCTLTLNANASVTANVQ